MPEEKYLVGRNVLVTRERSQARALSQLLLDVGARPLECPLIAFSPPPDWTFVDECLGVLSAYDGILFTSVNAVKFFWERVRDKGLDTSPLRQVPCYAIGQATAGALKGVGVQVLAVPEQSQAEGLAALLGKEGPAGKRFLFPRAREARDLLPRFLLKAGARVDLAVVYETRTAFENRPALERLLASERIDYVTFTSPSAVSAFVDMAPEGSCGAFPKNTPAACIGGITAAAARKAGFLVVFTAPKATVQSLVAAIVEHGRSQPERL